MLKTELAERLGLELPIIQAPMAASTAPELVAAVSNAGGLGSHGCANFAPEQLNEQMQAIRERTNRAFNLNFFAHEAPVQDTEKTETMRALMAKFHDELGLGDVPEPQPLFRPFDGDYLAALLADPPKVVSFHFGLPAAALVQPLKDAGVFILSSATTVAEARWLEDHGVNAVIAQGAEAGGHRGTFLSDDYRSALVGTMALVPQVVDAVQVPVIAAGGIADGRGMAAALMLGAQAVQIGTAFLTTAEAATNQLYRDALTAAEDTLPTVTKSFSGKPARGLRNRYVEEMRPHEDSLPDFPLTYYMNKDLRAAATKEGRGEFLAFWSGQAVGSGGRAQSQFIRGRPGRPHRRRGRPRIGSIPELNL